MQRLFISSSRNASFFRISLMGTCKSKHLISGRKIAVLSHNESFSTKIALSPEAFRPFLVAEIQEVSYNTKIYNIKFPEDHQEMGATVSTFLLVKGPDDSEGNTAIRPYTPISPIEQKGSFDLLVKTYPNGKVSSYLNTLKVGDTIEVKGPLPKLGYSPNMKSNIGMLAGGSGITPMLQVIREILKNPEDETQVSLVFANNKFEDILLKDVLDNLALKHKNFSVFYVLTEPPSENDDNHKKFVGSIGHVNMDIIKDKMPEPSENNLVFVCGPPGFMKAVSGDKTPDKKQGILEGLLKDAGYSEEMVFKF